MSKTLGDFIELLRQSQSSELPFWLSRLEEEVGEKEWKESMAFILNPENIIAFAEALGILVAERLNSICSEGLYRRIRQEGHEMLKEVHQKAVEHGIGVALEQIDRPLTISEAMAAAGLVSIDENDRISLTEAGKKVAEEF